MHMPKTLNPLRSSDVGVRQAAVSEDDPNNLILSTEAGVIIMTDLSQEIQVPLDIDEVSNSLDILHLILLPSDLL
jgi:hypothetical protein